MMVKNGIWRCGGLVRKTPDCGFVFVVVVFIFVVVVAVVVVVVVVVVVCVLFPPS